MSNIIGIRNNNTIVPYIAATKRTKQLDIKADVTYNVGGETTGWTFTAVYAIFYADSLGNWRMRFNLRLLRDTGSVAVTSATITFTNITNFQITQGIIGSLGAVTAVLSVASGSTKNLTLNLASTTVNILYASGDVMLSSEPTIYTTAANMEGVTAVDVYIPPASATSAGLVSTQAQTFTGQKQFSNFQLIGPNWTSTSAGSGTILLPINYNTQGKAYLVMLYYSTTITNEYITLFVSSYVGLNTNVFILQKSATQTVSLSNSSGLSLLTISGINGTPIFSTIGGMMVGATNNP